MAPLFVVFDGPTYHKPSWHRSNIMCYKLQTCFQKSVLCELPEIPDDRSISAFCCNKMLHPLASQLWLVQFKLIADVNGMWNG